MANKRFNFAIRYLQLIAVFSGGFCFAMMFFQGLDPWHGLDQLLWMDLYGRPQLPEQAKPAYLLIFWLFCWLSVLTFSLLYLIVTYPLRNRETWAYHALLITGICWPAGGAVIALLSGATSYFISVGMMALLFLPVIIILWPFFKSDKAGKTGPLIQHD